MSRRGPDHVNPTMGYCCASVVGDPAITHGPVMPGSLDPSCKLHYAVKTRRALVLSTAFSACLLLCNLFTEFQGKRNIHTRNKMSRNTHLLDQVWCSTLDQSKNCLDCQIMKAANHRRQLLLKLGGRIPYLGLFVSQILLCRPMQY